jgi:hypothetical protein
MKSLRLTLFVIGFYVSACGSFSASTPASSSGSSSFIISSSVTINPTIASTDPNVLPVTVGCGYANEPCVSVTICQHGSSTCVTVNNILLDTGSYGLRIFGSALSSLGSLPGVSPDSGSGNLTECQSYLDGSSDWGPLSAVDVQLGSQTASNARIQVIEATYPGIPSDCTNPDTSPSDVGFNGIIGVGMFASDCGEGCADTADNETYYACSGSTCTNVAIAEANQLQNPVTLLSTNNNGVALQLNAPTNGMAASVSGYLVLGIGTQTNNTPIGAAVLNTDSDGNISTSFNGSTYTAFLDSGSNTMNFNQPSSIPLCDSSSDAPGFLCPSSLVTLTAVQSGTNGIGTSITFGIDNAVTLLDSGDNALTNLGTPYADGFDWGLPFFFGKTVYVGFDGATSSIGSGTYWAY